MPLPTTLQFRFISRKKLYRKKSYNQYQALLKAWWMLQKGLHQELAACWTSKFMERIMLRPPFSEDCATKPTRERNGDEGCRNSYFLSRKENHDGTLTFSRKRVSLLKIK